MVNLLSKKLIKKVDFWIVLLFSKALGKRKERLEKKEQSNLNSENFSGQPKNSSY